MRGSEKRRPGRFRDLRANSRAAVTRPATPLAVLAPAATLSATLDSCGAPRRPAYFHWAKIVLKRPMASSVALSAVHLSTFVRDMALPQMFSA
jgi:hypothetical protein